MRFFSIESPLYKFITRFWDMVKLNFLWLVFSIPIVTVGAATVAVHSVTLKMVKDHEGHIARQFVQAFKENWRQGIPMGLMAMVAAYFVYLNFEFFNKIEGNPILFLIAAIVIIFFALIYFTYAFAICARYHNSLINILKNSASISIKFFGKTLLLWAIIAILIVLFMFNTTLMLFGILIGPVCVFLTISGFAVNHFKAIDPKEEQ